jgi:condensin complex subunit 1
MDVDGEEDEAAEAEEDEADEDTSMTDESSAGPSRKRSKKAKAKKPRQSGVDITVLTDEQAALAALQSSDLLHLRLKRKYCAEALSFIHQIEAAMPQLERLLGSTSKPEVLETMDFFRCALVYEIKVAEVSLLAPSHPV